MEIEALKDFDMEDLAVMFVWFLEGKMDGLLGFTTDDLHNYADNSNHIPEVGEAESPTEALLFKGGSISIVPGTSADLYATGFEPYSDAHFNTQYALIITKALATFHAHLRLSGKTSLATNSSEGYNTSDDPLTDNSFEESYCKDPSNADKDDWTCQVSRPKNVSANLSILSANFKQIGVSPRIVDKLDCLQEDIPTLTQFLQFAAVMQSSSRLQSIGPVNMCDIWVPSSTGINNENQGEDVIVIRLRGGSRLQAPPLRDIAWTWLTLLRPEVLLERYMELCELYCASFNDKLERGHLDGGKQVEEITLFDIMRDLGESFLHSFLTIVHKSTVSGVWSLDRRLHTSEGMQTLAESIGFLVENGIIGSLFVA